MEILPSNPLKHKVKNYPEGRRGRPGYGPAPTPSPSPAPGPGSDPGSESSLNSKIWDPIVPDNPIPWSEH